MNFYRSLGLVRLISANPGDPGAQDAPIIALNAISDRGTAGDLITNDTTPRIDLTLSLDAADGDVLKGFSNGALYASKTLGDNHFQDMGNDGDDADLAATALSDGLNNITFTITSGGLQSAQSNTLAITVNTSGRGVPVMSKQTGPTTTTPYIRFTFSNSPAAQAGDSIFLLNADRAQIATATLSSGDISAGHKDISVGTLLVSTSYTYYGYIATASNTFSPVSGALTFTITPDTLSIIGTPVTTGTQLAAYAGFTVTASGGTLPYVYSDRDSKLPPNVTIDPDTGVISGGLAAAGTFSAIVIRVTDAAAQTADLASFTITVSAATQQWNPFDAEPGLVFSTTVFANDTVTNDDSVFGAGAVRGTVGWSSGTKIIRIAVSDSVANQLTVGVCNLSADLTSSMLDGNGIGYVDTGLVATNNGTSFVGSSYTGGDAIDIVVNKTSNKAWFRKVAGGVTAGNWNNDVIGNQNPATNTGGVSISHITGAVFPFVRTFTFCGHAAVMSGFGDYP